MSLVTGEEQDFSYVPIPLWGLLVGVTATRGVIKLCTSDEVLRQQRWEHGISSLPTAQGDAEVLFEFESPWQLPKFPILPKATPKLLQSSLAAREMLALPCRAARSWHPDTRLGKRLPWVYGITPEEWIYGICAPHRRGMDQYVLQNLCLNPASAAAMKHLLPAFPALEPSSAHEMGAQVYCLKIKTWPCIFVGVRQNRGERQWNCQGTDCKSVFNFVC